MRKIQKCEKKRKSIILKKKNKNRNKYALDLAHRYLPQRI